MSQEGASARRGGALGRLGLFWAVAVACVVVDQLVKAWAMGNLTPGVATPFIPGVMDLVLVRNTGAAFSMGEGMGWVFVLIALAVVAVLCWLVGRTPGLPAHLTVLAAMVAGGGIGNLIDRICRGWVCDFFATSFMDFAVFNVADIFVSVGAVVGMVALYLWEDRRDRDTGEGSHGHGGA